MKRTNALLRQENRQGWMSVLPVIILEILICAYPIGMVIAKSFTNWDGMLKNDFVGLRNYIKLFQDETFWILIENTIIYILSVPVLALVGVALAMVLYRKPRGWKLYRFIYYLPSMISMVTLGFLFRILFSYNGPINDILRAIGLENLAIEWLGKEATARSVIFFVLVWSNLGWQILIIFGGLSNIPQTVFEAATLDGANYWQQLFHITIPMLIRTIEYSFITSILFIFSSIFPLILAITKGGPGYSTTTLDYMVYIKGFSGSKLGQACALSVVLLIIITVITVIQMKASNRMADWEG